MQVDIARCHRSLHNPPVHSFADFLHAHWLTVLYALLGPGAWLVFGFAMIKGRRRLEIRLKSPPAIDAFPPVSVLVPCRNEEAGIAACGRSILAQDYPNFDLIAVNDRSVDRTGAVLDEIAATDARLKVIHVEPGEVPAGWMGKPAALVNGVRHVPSLPGQWLIFIDSDCVLAPNAVREAVVTGVARRFDLVSFVPRYFGEGFWAGVMTPLCGIATSGMFQIMFANSTMQPKIAFACGQFIAIRREVYDAIGGHAAVKDSAGEDVELARLLKRGGYRPRIGWGMDLITTRMYSGLGEIINGWGRNFIAASRGKPWRVLGAVAFVILCGLSVWPALMLGDHSTRWVAIVHAAMITGLLCVAYRQAGSAWVRGLLWPMSSLMLLTLFSRSLWLCYTRRITWRGGAIELKTAGAAPATGQ